MSISVLSLFDGMSCGQIALNRAGIEYNRYFASEIDKYAIRVAMENYPNTIQLGGVEGIEPNCLPNIDLLIGGSPCQGFSFAGGRLNFGDPRSTLFFEFVRVLKGCKPIYFLFENVRMKKECREVISEFLGVEPIEINSALVSAQSRRRLYWTNILGVTQPEDRNILLNDVVDGGAALKEKSQTILSTIYKENVKSMIKRNKMGLLVRIGEEAADLRKLNPLECERLQTVPENYTNFVSKTQRYRMLGNGWTVDIISHIFRGLHKK